MLVSIRFNEDYEEELKLPKGYTERLQTPLGKQINVAFRNQFLCGRGFSSGFPAFF